MPQLEEYFIFNPKQTYPTQSPAALGGMGGIKMTKNVLYELFGYIGYWLIGNL